MLSVEREHFNKEGFEVQSFLELRIWEAISAEAGIKKNLKNDSHCEKKSYITFAKKD